MGVKDIKGEAMTDQKNFRCCEKCGKKLIERGNNGIWHFVFGRQRTNEGELSRIAPVEMHIYGSLKMKCFRWECRKQHPEHWNVLNFFPFRDDFDSSTSDNQPS